MSTWCNTRCTLLVVGTVLAAGPTYARPGEKRPRAVDNIWTVALHAVNQLVDRRPVVAIQTLSQARVRVPEFDTLAALAAVQGRKPDEAAQLINEAIRHKSTSPWTYYWAARIEWLRGKKNAARQHMNNALTLGQQRRAIHAGYAVIGSNTRSRRASVHYLVRASANFFDHELFPSPSQGAIDLLEDILSGYSDRTMVDRTRMHLYWRIGRVLPAMRLASKLVSANTDDGNAMITLAQCEHALGHHRKATQTAERAVAINPNARALATLGDIFMERNAPNRSMLARGAQLLVRAADLDPQNGPLLLRAAQACPTGQSCFLCRTLLPLRAQSRSSPRPSPLWTRCDFAASRPARRRRSLIRARH